MAMGAIQERVDYEVGRIMDNILDLNTKATAKRKITITLELAPNSDRSTVVVSAVAKSTLAPTEPVITSLYLTTDPESGDNMAVEMVPQVPGQMSAFLDQEQEPKILKFAKQE